LAFNLGLYTNPIKATPFWLKITYLNRTVEKMIDGEKNYRR
jgi:hypothetical protein